MPDFAWTELLGDWSRHVLGGPGWLGLAGATEAEIRAAEERLRVRLPPSYREFLETSNGWPSSGNLGSRLWRVDEIEWFRVTNEEYIAEWMYGVQLGGGPSPVPDEVYFVYGRGQQSANIRDEYLSDALQISESGEQVHLLNPRVISADGEWEAWYFAPWLPGAIRYRSFWELLQNEYRSRVLGEYL